MRKPEFHSSKIGVSEEKGSPSEKNAADTAAAGTPGRALALSAPKNERSHTRWKTNVDDRRGVTMAYETLVDIVRVLISEWLGRHVEPV